MRWNKGRACHSSHLFRDLTSSRSRVCLHTATQQPERRIPNPQPLAEYVKCYVSTRFIFTLVTSPFALSVEFSPVTLPEHGTRPIPRTGCELSAEHPLQRSTHRASSSSTTRRISIMHGITPHDSCELRTRSAESPDFAVAPNPRLHWFIIGKIA
jgi:hypothetical protein